MNSSKKLDWIVGIFVLLGLGAIATLSISIGGATYSGKGGLTLFATFDEIGGLKDRAPVLIAGVKVGLVQGISLSEDYRAKVQFDVDDTLMLPIDSSASIRTAGLLGDQFIHIELGAEEEVLVVGEELAYTEDAIVIETLIGKLVHNLGIKKDE
jgi:phospholipid/cholesterol/gamma-HCH transport system substrate-binding protein